MRIRHPNVAPFFVFLFLLSAFAGLARGGVESGAATAEAPARNYNLPQDFVGLIVDRKLIDHYQTQFHRIEPGITPVPNTAFTERNRGGRFVRTMRNQPSEEVLKYWRAVPAKAVPSAAFRAPILERSMDRPTVDIEMGRLSETERRAARFVAEHLASDGLLATLRDVLEILGPARFATNGMAGIEQLLAVGYPVDLLNYFSISNEEKHAGGNNTNRVLEVVAYLSSRFPVKAERDAFGKFQFRFFPSRPGFKVATETGEAELGLARMQVGGGYRGGIIPGDNLDVVCQVVDALPNCNFLISVPFEFLDRIEWIATHTWRLRHAGQVTIVSEPLSVGAWAQDDGKAGYLSLARPDNEKQEGTKAATLVPRYASIDEGKSTFEPGESLLMDGLKAAGHEVAHSGLLFQGGNLLPVRDPKSGERLLLVSEGEIFRNAALGLTREQVIEAFRTEFSVNRCAVVPAVSYHLDFDVSIRAVDGELIAFVNDTPGAARIIAGLGIDTLEHNGVLDSKSTQRIREDLAGGRDLLAVRRLTTFVDQQAKGRSDFPASLSKFFVRGKTDSAAGNLQTFLLALDLIESAAMDERDFSGIDAERAEYLRALKRFEAARRRQGNEIAKLGCKVVAVPSMTDLYRGINYLNGIQYREGYVMPVFGGFYAALDQAAVAAFRKVIGPDLRISTIYSAECERAQGGVHCTVAAYGR